MASKELYEPIYVYQSRMIWKDHVNMYHLVKHTSIDDHDYTMYNEDVYIYTFYE